MRALILLACAVCVTAATGEAAAPRLVTVSVDAGTPGPAIAPDFLGLSFEMATLLPDGQGRRLFRADNRRLLATFQTLGIHSLRVGGNTADRPTVPVPAEADIDSLFGFARAAGVKVIYTLRLREGSREAAARTARHIASRYEADLACFAIGNEPNVFATRYPAYLAEWKRYVAEITDRENAVRARFCGPSATPAKVAWAADFVRDVGEEGRVAIVTQHDYPGNSARTVADPAAARREMLSRAWARKYESFHDAFVPAVLSKRLPYRLEEANSFFHGGAKDVSDTQASALWALDYMYWWATHRASGINFHTGDEVAAGEANTPCRYAAFWTAPDGYSVRPIGYAMKAFEIGSRGRPLPVGSASTQGDLTAYAVLSADGTVYLTLVNKNI